MILCKVRKKGGGHLTNYVTQKKKELKQWSQVYPGNPFVIKLVLQSLQKLDEYISRFIMSFFIKLFSL